MEGDQTSRRTFSVSLTGEITTPPLFENGNAEGDLRFDIKCINGGKFCRSDLISISMMAVEFIIAQINLLMPGEDTETSDFEGLKLLQGETIQ